jgi:hypothetical protein
MSAQTFYFMFIPTFTVLAFMIGGTFALMAISANLGAGGDDDAENGH